jgi:hypothetical protein
MLLVPARRVAEDGDVAAILARAERAEAIFAELGDEAWRAQSVRWRAAALLRQRKIDGALARLATAITIPATILGNHFDVRSRSQNCQQFKKALERRAPGQRRAHRHLGALRAARLDSLRA